MVGEQPLTSGPTPAGESARARGAQRQPPEQVGRRRGHGSQPEGGEERQRRDPRRRPACDRRGAGRRDGPPGGGRRRARFAFSSAACWAPQRRLADTPLLAAACAAAGGARGPRGGPGERGREPRAPRGPGSAFPGAHSHPGRRAQLRRAPPAPARRPRASGPSATSGGAPPCGPARPSPGVALPLRSFSGTEVPLKSLGVLGWIFFVNNIPRVGVKARPCPVALPAGLRPEIPGRGNFSVLLRPCGSRRARVVAQGPLSRGARLTGSSVWPRGARGAGLALGRGAGAWLSRPRRGPRSSGDWGRTPSWHARPSRSPGCPGPGVCPGAPG